jgi:hypothetical protein
MLMRIHVKGCKSLADVEVRLSPLSLLFGPNASGKSIFLDALQLLSKLATTRVVKDAFDPPYRGKPLESFRFGAGGIKGLLAEERLSFSMEADFELSAAIVDAVNREIRDMRRPSRGSGEEDPAKSPAQVRERNLRYRIEVEMLPRSGLLRVAEECLAALNAKGEPTGKRTPLIERKGDKLHLRLEGQAHPTYYDLFLDHMLLSMPHYPPHAPFGIIGGKLGIDIRIGETGRPSVSLHLGDRRSERRRAGAPAEHAADQATDGLAIADVGERGRRLGFDRDGHVNGLVPLCLRPAEYSRAVARRVTARLSAGA